MPTGSKFTAKERDAETGLDHYWFRKSSSAQGRFTSPDPMGGHLTSPQSLNRYAYVRNDPLNLIDPFGLDCVYTTQMDDKGKVTVVRGDCLQKNDGGLFVKGTIDLNSFTYNSEDNAIGFSYKGDQPGVLGHDVLGLQEGSAKNWSVSLFDRSSGSSLSGFGFFERGQLDPSARQTLSQTYRNTNTVVDPRFIAGFYVASALAGVALAGASGAAGIQFAPALTSELASYLQFGSSLLQNPHFLNFARDAVLGYAPGPAPATLGGLTGFAVANRARLYNGLRDTYRYVQGSIPH